MIRVGVDAHVITGKFQGSQTYLRNIFERVGDDLSFKYMMLGDWLLDHKYFKNTRLSLIGIGNQSRFSRIFLSGKLVRKFNIDVYHSQYIVPFGLGCKTVVTIHDLLPFTHKEFFPKANGILLRFLFKNSARRADQIHTVSNYTKEKIVELFGVDGNKIFVVPNGVDKTFFEKANAEALEKVKKMYGTYILSVGRIEPRKNYTNLIKAYKALTDTGEWAGNLVIVGQCDFGFKEVFSIIEDYELSEKVYILQNIENEDLALLYKCASVFVYPSFGEGFGIPPIEAMASGVPVITSNNTALPEVVGDAAILINPYSVNDIVEAIKLVCFNSDFREELISKGYERAKMWTWHSASQKYERAIRKLV